MDFVFRRSYCGPVRAVILDWAGTAVDYGSFAPTAVFLGLFQRHGVEITPEDARSGMGLMKKDHLRTILRQPRVASAWQAVHRKPPTEADIENLFADFVPLQITILKNYAKPIPGLLEVVEDLRERGIGVGTTTGYLRSMMDVLGPEAARRGYKPDQIVCPDDVPAGRPYPWMCYLNAMRLGAYPMEALVKVGDTLPDIEEGLNAGMWSVGVSLTGSLLGLSEADESALTIEERTEARERIETTLLRPGAHYVIDGIWDLPEVLEDIEDRLAQGERP